MRLILVGMLAALMVSAHAQAAELSALRILFVGSDPATLTLTAEEKTQPFADRMLALRKVRTPQFEQLLRRYFKTVKVVYAKDYQEALSADYDVTVFDAEPRPIQESFMENDPKTGQPVRFHAAEYLTAQFSAAALLISTNSPKLAEPLEYKMDWLCECLEAHAHDIRLDHPIFNTPYKVKPTLEYRPTPESYRHYYAGRDLPKVMPMWRAQKEAHEDGKGYPSGLVSTGRGFTDASDAEVIADGVNTKTQDSVALARHGNFFHWGFSASPQDMTDQAQLAFINSVHYIARFKGQRPYSRRPFRMAFPHNRQVALDLAYIQTQQTYEDWVKQQKDSYEMRQDYLHRMQQAGQQLDESDVKAMTEPMPALPTREQWLKEAALSLQAPSVVAQFGSALDKYLPYYRQNLGYLVPGPKLYTFEVDEDVRSLAVPNHDVELLELCVAMLESNLDVTKATRILTRYSGEKLQTPQQWRKWLDSNRSRLYFSDEDGYRFHVAPVALRQ